MSDEVSAEEAQRVIDDVAHARAGGLMSAGGEHAALTMEHLARTVVILHRELAVLRAQLAPLLAVHDALVAAAALPGAGASPEEMVAAVRTQGAEAMRADISATLDARADWLIAEEAGRRDDDRATVLADAAAIARGVPVRALPLPGAEVSRG